MDDMRNGVIMQVLKHSRRYWLPGVATFTVAVPGDGTVVVDRVERIAAQPAVQVEPQARTRGFPPPDRSPWQPKPKAAPQAV